MQIIKSLANNFSIQELEGLKNEWGTIRAILERNKQGKFKKVCKVMVVGEARTGKTSLVRSLNNKPFNENQSVTNVIEISDFSSTSKSFRNEVEMKIFDFGGQDIFNFIHPLFQSSQQCIAILVVNQYTQSLERMKEQITFLKNFHQSEILVVATSFNEEEVEGEKKSQRIDQDHKLNERDIESLGILKDRFVAISNKEKKGIEQVVKAIEQLSELKTIGWGLSSRGDCLRHHLTLMQDKYPVIPNFKGELETECDHNHLQSFSNDLVILENSGWIFTFTRNSSLSVIHEKLIVQILQGLFTIDMHIKKGVLTNRLLVDGLMSEINFKKYCNKVYQANSRNAAGESEMREAWEIVADLISSFSICHRIGKRESKGIMPHILFPSLLPTFNEAKHTMWDNLQLQEKRRVTRKLIVAEKYGDKRKVMDFIFPRLMIKMWNEVVDVKLCFQDKFVLRGDATPDDFSQEVRNMKNFMIVSRTENQEIKVERFGECFGRMFQLEEDFDSLFLEFRKCFGVTLSSRESGKNFELRMECSVCEEYLPQTVFKFYNFEAVCEWIGEKQYCKGCNRKHLQVEIIENPSDLARIFYLLKKFGKSTNKVEEELGDFVNFPRNQITVADKVHNKFLKGKKFAHLKIQRKLRQVSAKEAIFQCCFQEMEDSEVMVSKYFHCRMIDYTMTIEPKFEEHLECKHFEELLREIQGNRWEYSSFTKSVEQFKSKSGHLQVSNSSSCVATFTSKFEELKKWMNSDFYDLFSKELKRTVKQLDGMATSLEKVKSVLEMMNKICMLISRANTMEAMKTLRLQTNALQSKKGAMFSEVALHSFDDVFVEVHSHPPKPVIVDLMNIFDSPVDYRPSLHVYFRVEIQQKLFLFLQICRAVAELKSMRIVHRNITQNNTVVHSRSNWVCLSSSGFGMAIKCPTDEMILSPSEHKALCGARIPPPELNKPGAIKMDKFDVHSLGLMLEELINSLVISCMESEFLHKVQKRMVCEYEERMSIEEVIGVVEWMLFAKDPHGGLSTYEGIYLPTAKIWDSLSDQEILEKQKRLLLTGIGKGGRFSMGEMMEIHFMLTFSLAKKK